MKSVLKVLAFLFFVLFLFVSTQFAMVYLEELREKERNEYLDHTAREIVSSMSPAQKIGQVIHIAIPGKTLDPVAIKEIERVLPGGIIHFGKNLGTESEILSLNESLQNLAKKLNLPPLLISTDQEGGRVFRVRDGVAQFPGAMAVGQTMDEDLGYQVGFMTSYQLNRLGINFLLAPSLDINNNPKNPVINTRSFGSDIERVTKVAGAYERGARLGGAIPVIKHFPGHGDTDVDSHLGLPIIRKTLEDLQAMELIPFQRAIQAGSEVVMSAHILFPEIDPQYPATLSKKILTEILREEMGFKGLVITDAMEMHAISKNYQKDRPGVKALLAGADILLLTSWGETAENLLKELLLAEKNGDFSENGFNRLDEAVYRQVRLKLSSGIYTKNRQPLEPAHPGFLEFEKKRSEERESVYQSILKDPDYAYSITKKTIRSYPAPYQFPKDLNPAQVSVAITNPKIFQGFPNSGFQKISKSEIPKLAKTKTFSYFILDASSEQEIKKIAAWAETYPESTWVVLYPGTPFIDLPEKKNLKILFSFSITDHSLRALGEKSTSETEIPEMDLILLNSRRMQN